MAEYFSSLREAASSAAEPASQEAPVTYESASGHVTVTSQHSALSSIAGTKMIPFASYKAPQTQSRLPSPTK